MAHGVTSEPVHLHQALHGYADGHRLLASSVPLKGRDSKIMLTLSDASGSSSRIDNAGYITGYPLAEAGLYALAKTWPAPEMPRPGCVWTHTLLVDFTDLATLTTLAPLANAFRRPIGSGPPFEGYEKSLLLPQVGPSEQLLIPHINRAVLRRLAWALYGQPQARVVSSEATLEEREHLLLMLWSQQWPRLRRSFRFCTLVYSDRSSDGSPFDLQFAPADDRSIRSRFAKLVDADREPSETLPRWLEEAVDDLIAGDGQGGLRAFLRELGAELEGGRELFEPLCHIHSLLSGSEEGISEAIKLIEGPLRGADARDVRTRLVARVSENASRAGAEELRFALDHLSLLTSTLRASAEEHLSKVLWAAHPQLAVECMQSTDPDQRSVAVRGLASAKAADLVAALRDNSVLLPSIFQNRRDLLGHPEIWAADGQLADLALSVALRNPLKAEYLDAIIDSSNSALIAPVVQSAGAEAVLSRLLARVDARRGTEFLPDESAWFASSAASNVVAAVFGTGRVEERSTLAVCARHIRPDDVPNEFGEDPCWIAFRNARELPPGPASLFLSAWLLARGLGYRSRNQAELIAAGIEEIYPAALASRMPDDIWQLLDGRLPNSYFWSGWDRGHRLRAGVAKAFVGRGLAPIVFGQLLQDDNLFAEFAVEAARVLWSRDYLRSVKRALQDLDSARLVNRIAIIQRLL